MQSPALGEALGVAASMGTVPAWGLWARPGSPRPRPLPVSTLGPTEVHAGRTASPGWPQPPGAGITGAAALPDPGFLKHWLVPGARCACQSPSAPVGATNDTFPGHLGPASFCHSLSQGSRCCGGEARTLPTRSHHPEQPSGTQSAHSRGSQTGSANLYSWCVRSICF